MKQKVLKVHPDDNVLVALQDLSPHEVVQYNGASYRLTEPIPAKHKFAATAFDKEDAITMYGVLVGRAKQPIPIGSRIAVENVHHAAGSYALSEKGEIPADFQLVGNMVQDVCYNNAKSYFGWE